MSRCSRSFSGPTVILSMFIGAIVGAAAVVLLAPRARKESAERIRKFSRDLKEGASSSVDTAREKISSTVSRGRDFLRGKRSVISSAVEAGKDAYLQRMAEVPGEGPGSEAS